MVSASRLFSASTKAVKATVLRTDANVVLITRSGETGRPELFRDVRDARSVSPSNTRLVTVSCTSRANNSALPPALRHGKRGANTNHRISGENEAVVPWPRVTGRPAHRDDRPATERFVAVGRVRAMRAAGADGVRASRPEPGAGAVTFSTSEGSWV
jgi:hypothetical protein